MSKSLWKVVVFTIGMWIILALYFKGLPGTQPVSDLTRADEIIQTDPHGLPDKMTQGNEVIQFDVKPEEK